MLDPLWSWLALKNPLRGKVTWYISLALVDQEFNCLKGHVKDCSPPGPTADAKVNVVAVGTGSLVR